MAATRNRLRQFIESEAASALPLLLASGGESEEERKTREAADRARRKV